MNRIERIVNDDDPTSALCHLTQDDVRHANKEVLHTLQQRIGDTLTHKNTADARWLRIYIAGLMRGVDFMADAVLDDTRAVEIAQQLSLAFVHAREVITTPHYDSPSPTTLIGTMALAVIAICCVVFLGLFTIKHGAGGIVGG